MRGPFNGFTSSCQLIISAAPTLHKAAVALVQQHHKSKMKFAIVALLVVFLASVHAQIKVCDTVKVRRSVSWVDPPSPADDTEEPASLVMLSAITPDKTSLRIFLCL
jgi:hypothetical protein